MKNLKNLIVEYVGNKFQPKDENVTPEMVVTVLADEFPEITLLLAEENFLRGYTQALTDKTAVEEEMNSKKDLQNDEKST